MKNIAANLILALCAIVFSTSCGTGKVPEVGSAEAAAQLQKDLKGTYEELFSENTSLNPKWDAYWLSECEKAVGAEAAQSRPPLSVSAMAQMVGRMDSSSAAISSRA